MHSFTDLGFSFAIDDVGAGYSGLETVATLKPAYLKIDIALVRDVHQKKVSQQVVKAILDMGAGLGATVIAEGIQAREEADAVLQLGVPWGQGYFYARPVDPYAPKGEGRGLHLSARRGHHARSGSDRRAPRRGGARSTFCSWMRAGGTENRFSDRTTRSADLPTSSEPLSDSRPWARRTPWCMPPGPSAGPRPARGAWAPRAPWATAWRVTATWIPARGFGEETDQSLPKETTAPARTRSPVG